MGFFGHGPLENDVAMDVRGEWCQHVDDGASPAQAVDVLLESWGEALPAGRELEVIGLVGICFDENIEAPGPLVDAAAAAIEQQLTANELETWSDPAARRRALLELRDQLGAPLNRSSSSSRHPQIHFSSIEEARNEVSKIVEEALEGNGELSQAAPEFMRRAWDLTSGDRDRVLLLAGMLALRWRLDPDEADRLLFKPIVHSSG